MAASRRKGKNGELELAKILRGYEGVDARRGQQYKGTPDSPDLITNLKGLHWEVKRVERLNLYPALRQATSDAHHDQIPVVAYRRNRESWAVLLYLDDFMELINGQADPISGRGRLHGVVEPDHGGVEAEAVRRPE